MQQQHLRLLEGDYSLSCLVQQKQLTSISHANCWYGIVEVPERRLFIARSLVRTSHAFPLPFISYKTKVTSFNEVFIQTVRPTYSCPHLRRSQATTHSPAGCKYPSSTCTGKPWPSALKFDGFDFSKHVKPSSVSWIFFRVCRIRYKIYHTAASY
jgi:hypothetical protein